MGLPPGTWTDDTAMARNLWLSLIDARGPAGHGRRPAPAHRLARDPDRPTWATSRGRSCRAAPTGSPTPRGSTWRARAGGQRRQRLGDVLRPAGVVCAPRPDDLLDARARPVRDHALGRALPHRLPRRDARRGVPGARRARRHGGRGPRCAPWRSARAARSSSTSWARPGRARPLDGPDMGFTLFTAGIALQVCGRGAGVRGGAPTRGGAGRRHRHERRRRRRAAGRRARAGARCRTTGSAAAGRSRVHRVRGRTARGARLTARSVARAGRRVLVVRAVQPPRQTCTDQLGEHAPGQRTGRCRTASASASFVQTS